MATTPLSLPQTPGLRQPALPVVTGLSTGRVALLAILVALVLGGASLVYLNLAATVANSSTRLQDVTRQRRALEWQRAERAQDLARLTHPDRLEARAQELGFRAPTSMTYVTISPEVGAALDLKLHPDITPPRSEPPPPSAWDGLRSQFQQWLGR